MVNLSSNKTFDLNSSIHLIPSEFRSNLLFQSIIFIVYSVIFILGILGNALICLVELRSREEQSATKFFIANLAVGEIFLCVFGIPFTLTYTLSGTWIFGRFMCTAVPFVQSASVYICTLSLACIAVDRCILIVYPRVPAIITILKSKKIIAAIWLIAFCLTLPYGCFIEQKQEMVNNCTVIFCQENWPNNRFQIFYSVFTPLLQFVIPFLILKISDFYFMRRLDNNFRRRRSGRNDIVMQNELERNRRIVRLLKDMGFAFVISWLPLNIFNILDDFQPALSRWRYKTLLFFTAHGLAMTSTCINPILYAWRNEIIKKEIKKILPCFQTPDPQKFQRKLMSQTTQPIIERLSPNDL